MLGSRPESTIPQHPRFVPERPLGEGGMGIVWLVRDRARGDRPTALKMCRPGASRDEFVREFRLLRALRHPAFVRASEYGVFPVSGEPYFLMEAVAGSSLADLAPVLRADLREGRLERVLAVLRGVAEAVAHLHDRGYVHLDLKLENVLSSADGVRIIDLGAAVHSGKIASSSLSGTVPYAAPEVIAGESADTRADLYSLGVSFCLLLTGQYPVGGGSRAELENDALHRAPRLPDDLPSSLARIVRKLLAKSPNHRYRDIHQLIGALSSLESSSAEEAHPKPACARVDLELVGREKELDRLLEWWERRREGSGAPVLSITGESGSGKTRFAEAAVAELSALGAEIVLVPEETDAQSLLRETLSRALAGAPLGSADAKAFAELLAGVGLSSDGRALPSGEFVLDRELDLRDALRLLMRGGEHPIVLVVDRDARADPCFGELLRVAAVEPLSKRAFGIIVTGNVPQAESETVCLRPIPEGAAMRALSVVAPELPLRSRKRIIAGSRGNAGEIVRRLREELAGSVGGSPTSEECSRRDENGSEESCKSADLPDELDEREVLEWLEIARAPLSERTLKELTGRPRAVIRRAIASLLEKGLASRLGGRGVAAASSGRAIAAISAAEIQRRHARLATVAKSSRNGREREAIHLVGSGELDRGLTMLRARAVELAEGGEPDLALRLYEDALAAASDAKAARLILEDLAERQERLGRFDAASEIYEGLVTDTDPSEPSRARLLRKLGAVALRRGENGAAHEALESALAVAEATGEVDERLRLFHELAALRLVEGDLRLAASLANRGLELLSEAELDPAPRAAHAMRLYSTSGHVLLREFEFARAAERLELALAHSRAAHDAPAAAVIRNNLGIAYHQSNRLDDALRVYEEAREEAAVAGDEVAAWSIRCNVAAIRARQGRFEDAAELFAALAPEIDERRSRRALLYFLHSRGLLERLLAADAASHWERTVRLADELHELPFAHFGRLCLLEDHVWQGRWAEARRLVDRLEAARPEDPRLVRAFLARRAWFEARCGHEEAARRLLGSAFPERENALRSEGAAPSHGDLWDHVLAAAAAVEIGDCNAAIAWLREISPWFERSGQVPGVVECLILLVEAALREQRLAEATELFRRLERIAPPGSDFASARGGLVRIPFLAARLELARARPDRARARDLLASAAGSLPASSRSELLWILAELAGRQGEPGAERRAAIERRRFLRAMSPADRSVYARRDLDERLGLVRGAAIRGRRGDALRRRASLFQALAALDSETEPARGLRRVLDACGARRGAVFLELPRGLVASIGLDDLDDGARESLRVRALEVGHGRLGAGLCRRLDAGEGSPRAVLWVECFRDDRPEAAPDLEEFLDLVVRGFRDLLGRGGIGETFRKRQTTVHLSSSPRTRALDGRTEPVAASPAMRQILALVERTADSRLPVLITGESGTGKDLIAGWIHDRGNRRDGPFLALDCAAIPEGLLEAELFGHVRGAFSGAVSDRPGYLREADGGTVYLDNVDSLPVVVQTKLLRVLETGCVRALGAESPAETDVRFIASAQRDPRELVLRGEFRGDLYHRLAGLCLALPPLRERAEDIPGLALAFARRYPEEMPHLTEEVISALASHSWPGNIRELETVLRRIRLAIDDDRPATREDVVRLLGAPREAPEIPRRLFQDRSWNQVLDLVKREYLKHLFEKHGGDLEAIASDLGISRRNVYLRFAQVGLRIEELRGG